MPLILCLETSSDICSVALAEGNKKLQSISANEKNIHSSKLSAFIKELFEKESININRLDAVAICRGPGSFTGLRIGVSFAKGLAFGLEIPLIAVDALKILTVQAIDISTHGMFFIPLINARNGEYYLAVYDDKLAEVTEAAVTPLNRDIIIKMSENKKTIVFGNTEELTEADFVNYPNITFKKGIQADAIHMIQFSYDKFLNNEFEDIDLFEPFYLKDFKARKSSEKIRRVLNFNKPVL